MKKAVLFVCGFAFAINALTAQVKEERQVQSFNQLNVTSAIKAIVTVGDKESVVFEAEEKVMKGLKAEVKKNELKLYYDGKENNIEKVTAYVTVKKLEGIVANGAAMVELTNTLTCDKMDIEASGAGSVKIAVIAKEINATSTGAGSIRISGTTQSLSAKASGAGSLKASELKSENVVVVADGAGSAHVCAKENLKANASGAGSIKYSEEPKSKDVKVSSAGSVKKA